MSLKIKVSKNKYAVVDESDFEILNKFKWNLVRGYAVTRLNGDKKHTFMHRIILNTPKGFDTDHINKDRLDNRRCNLRVATRSQNLANKSKQKNCTSIYKGVHWDKQMKKWKTGIRYKNKYFFIGLFINERHAAMAYDIWAKDFFKEFALLNFK